MKNRCRRDVKAQYRVQDVIDDSGLEYDWVFLEGTGAMVLDHVARVADTGRSRRADPAAWSASVRFQLRADVFDTADHSGRAVYHTNVMMSVGTEFALVGLDLITDGARCAEVEQRLHESGRAVIALNHKQIDIFAGNALELKGNNGRVLALSERAAESLTSNNAHRSSDPRASSSSGPHH